MIYSRKNVSIVFDEEKGVVTLTKRNKIRVPKIGSDKPKENLFDEESFFVSSVIAYRIKKFLK